YQAKSLFQQMSLVQPNLLPLYTELEIPNPKISDTDVNVAIITRLQQFHDIVSRGGADLLPLSSRFCHARRFGQRRRRICGIMKK
ncbi:MAG: hypothetical protein K2O85_07205, partial [Helicobacter sp.]|nr:hypothetical protein [Helicobacter sp.]